MLTKRVLFGEQQVVLTCDGRCDKAWGINGRPRHYFVGEETDPDDYVYLGDAALGTAPGPGETVGVSEGNDMKPSDAPLSDGERMNRWCARECERRSVIDDGEALTVIDMAQPQPNLSSRRGAAAAT